MNIRKSHAINERASQILTLFKEIKQPQKKNRTAQVSHIYIHH